MDRLIYLDSNATTPMAPHVRQAMVEAMDIWGNPSSAHQLGRKARERMELSREAVAAAAGADAKEIVFTSGGSEANALAILGTYFSVGEHFRLLTSAVEHSSVRDLVKWLEGRGVQVRTLGVDGGGSLDLAEVQEALTSFQPHLVSLMAANNETGVLFPIPEIGKLCAAHGCLLHTDAVQGLGKLDASHWKSADFVSLSAHKIYGPKGIGALVVRNGHSLVATHFGGAQETKRRGGTENSLGIVGFGAACGESLAGPEARAQIETLRDRLERLLLENEPTAEFAGKAAPRLGNTSSVRIPGIPAEILLGVLDMQGIAVSAGSACSSGSISPSHVLLAMGRNRDEAREFLRVSLGRGTTADDIDTFVKVVVNHVARIRSRKRRSE
jgi:cysteine desulfurase